MLVDRRSHSLVLRIAYDGPPGAGKATNLRHLCERLALGPRGPVEPAGGHDRSPRFFDWLDVTGGWTGSERIRCQLAAVPGQIELARRRRHILDSADAVIFVADSRPSSAPETTAALRSLARGLTDRADIPLVLQANKQDLPGAQRQQQLHDALGLAARVPVIAAHAASGAGVLETFLLAVRLAVDHVLALLVAGELGDDDAVAARDLLDSVAADTPAALEALAGAAGTTGIASTHPAREVRVTTRAPMAIVRAPMAATDEPIAGTDEPIAAADEPAAAVRAPMAAADGPAAVFREPMAVFREPMAAADEPMAAADEPMAAADEPMAAADEPAAVRAPMAAADEPAAVVREPMAITEPTAVFREPMAAADEPMAAADEPMAVAEPTAAVRESTAADDEPAALVREPMAADDEPAAVVREPTASAEEPAALVREPMTAAAEPAAVVRELMRSAPALRAVEPMLVAAPGERADPAATDDATRPIRVIRCQPVRTTSTAEARAMIDAAMQPVAPLFATSRSAASPLGGTPIASIARASQKPTAPPSSKAIAESDAANSEAETRPLRMNRFTPAKAILTRSLGPAPAAVARSGPIAIPILAAPVATTTGPIPVIVPLGTDPGIVPMTPSADGAVTARAPTAELVELDSVAAIGAVLLGEANAWAEPAVSFTDAGTLVAVVAVEAHTIEAIMIEPIAIEAITIERPPVEPPPASPVAAALLADAPPPFLGGDDDPTWELPAVDPGAPPAVNPGALPAAELDSTVLDAIARQDEVTAPIEMAPPVVAHGDFCVRIKPGKPGGAPAAPPTEPAGGEPPPPDAAALELPPMDLPAGMVWPGVSGRAALAAIAAPTRMADRPVSWAPRHAIELLCGEGWSAHTSTELVFDAEHGEQALADAVRWQTAVGALTPPGRTYALAPIGDRVRLWVLTPAYRTVWTTIDEAFARGDRATAARLARTGLEAVDELRARNVPIGDLDHIAVDDPPRLLATPWTPQRDRLIVQLQRLFAAAVL